LKEYHTFTNSLHGFTTQLPLPSLLLQGRRSPLDSRTGGLRRAAPISGMRQPKGRASASRVARSQGTSLGRSPRRQALATPPREWSRRRRGGRRDWATGNTQRSRATCMMVYRVTPHSLPWSALSLVGFFVGPKSKELLLKFLGDNQGHGPTGPVLGPPLASAVTSWAA
jgi:hypothetical protein